MPGTIPTPDTQNLPSPTNPPFSIKFEINRSPPQTPLEVLKDLKGELEQEFGPKHPQNNKPGAYTLGQGAAAITLKIEQDDSVTLNYKGQTFKVGFEINSKATAGTVTTITAPNGETLKFDGPVRSNSDPLGKQAMQADTNFIIGGGGAFPISVADALEKLIKISQIKESVLPINPPTPVPELSPENSLQFLKGLLFEVLENRRIAVEYPEVKPTRGEDPISFIGIQLSEELNLPSNLRGRYLINLDKQGNVTLDRDESYIDMGIRHRNITPVINPSPELIEAITSRLNYLNDDAKQALIQRKLDIEVAREQLK